MKENIIKYNFFGLSYSRQIMILDSYLSDLRLTDSCDDYKKVFRKYMLVSKKFNDFKDSFGSYTDEDRRKMRELINYCRTKINPNNEVRVDENASYYNALSINDYRVDEYIRDIYYSKNVIERIGIVDGFFSYYNEIVDYGFDEILSLFRCKKDFFNSEIKKIDNEFYSLYIRLNTVDRMKYIWHLAHFDVFTSENYNDGILDMYDDFRNDDTFIKPLHRGSRVSKLVSEPKDKVNRIGLSKYFKI